MKHYIVVTDSNSRQYVFEITDAGISVKSPRGEAVVTKEDHNLAFFFNAIREGHPFIINNSAVFAQRQIAAVQVQLIPDETDAIAPPVEEPVAIEYVAEEVSE
jgi:hypothetical protein